MKQLQEMAQQQKEQLEQLQNVINQQKQQLYANNIEIFKMESTKQLEKVTISEYRALGFGFRDRRVYETTKMILNQEINLEEMKKNPNTLEVKEQLLKLAGVGPKVADCILLFSTLKRLEVFPMDVWVRRVMNDLYLKQEETKVSKKRIQEIATQKFGNLAGLAQQYLYYWRREGET